MSTIVTGLFRNETDAAQAVHAIETCGVDPGRISLVAGDSFRKEAFGVHSHTKMAEGVAVGTTTGAAVGAIVAGLTAVGTIATGGLGILAAGPIVAALAGAGAGAAGGGVIGALAGVAIPEHEVKHYEDAIEKGSVLVGVECDGGDEKKLVKKAFEQCDAKKISHA